MWLQLEHLFIDKNCLPMKGGAVIKNKIISEEILPPNNSSKIDFIIQQIIES